MKTLSNFIKWFFYITVGILVVCGAGYASAGVETVAVDVFGKILLSAFITTLITLIFRPKEDDEKKRFGVKMVVHYLILYVTMCFMGGWFGWIEMNLVGILVMAIYVGLVYILAFTTHYIIDVKQAGEINKRLQEKYGDEEP